MTNPLFPAVGWRNDSDGSLNSVGAICYYWSSVANGSFGAYSLYFNSSNLNMSALSMRYGFSVRCVRQ
ncbi:MAG: fibrobacter succinogenes major paralogous domain-containing protein [Rikenellaceae bacterium]|nr:fibrobacter succinogenes major paralogous domain-containing protein [Rikenellaceae bacterium]